MNHLSAPHSGTRPRCRRAVTALALVAACAGDGTGTATPASIRFAGDPSPAIAGVPFAVTVELLDGAGRRIGGASAHVSLSLGGGAELSGATAVAAVSGVAVFDDLVITRAGAAFRLDAVALGRSASSAPFAVAPAAPSADRSAFSPDTFLWFEGTATPVVFTFRDAYGNPLADLPVSVASSLAGSAFAPASGVTTAAGVFTTTFEPASGGAATFSATVDNRTVEFGAPFVVTEFCRPGVLPVPGVVNGVLPAGVCDANGRPAAVYRFSLAAPGAVAITANAAFPPRIDVRTAINEPSPQFLPVPVSPTVEWLLPAGTYLFRIAAESGTGGYAVQSAPLAGNTGTAARVIITSGTYGGQSLTLNDRDFGDGTVYDYYLLFSPRSCTVTMRSTETDAYLWAEDAIALQFIANNDNGAGGTDARITLAECRRGSSPIGIFANANPTPAGPGVGAYSLTVEFGGVIAGEQSAPQAVPGAMRTATLRAPDVPVVSLAKPAPVRR